MTFDARISFTAVFKSLPFDSVYPLILTLISFLVSHLVLLSFNFLIDISNFIFNPLIFHNISKLTFNPYFWPFFVIYYSLRCLKRVISIWRQPSPETTLLILSFSLRYFPILYWSHFFHGIYIRPIELGFFNKFFLTSDTRQTLVFAANFL